LNREIIIQSIEKNLKDFYFSFKKGINSSFYQNDYLESIKSSWPSFVLLKDYNSDFEKVVKSLKNSQNTSKNWILDDKYVKNNQKLLKTKKMFPLNSWEGMYLFKDKQSEIKKVENFKVETLQKEDLQEFVSIVNSSVFHKNVISTEILLNIIDDDNFYFYVGKYKDKIVSTCLIFNNGVTNGLYFIATKDIFRGKGFAKNMVATTINNQINNNSNHFILHATKLGKGIYSNLGFKDYSKLIIFVKI